jgi:hypothetical protein
MNLEYLDDPVIIERPLWWHLKRLQYTASGYGRKIPTTKMVKLNGRLYRIYCSIYSNCGSCWIQTKEGKVFIRM